MTNSANARAQRAPLGTRALKHLARLVSVAPRERRGLARARAYAIGDIHGRLDLLEQLLALIEADSADREPRRTYLIFLGDLIDRGPDSAGVVELICQLCRTRPDTICLSGNHEEFFQRVLAGEKNVLEDWLRYGGAECIASYGISVDELRGASEQEQLALIKAAIPSGHADFLRVLGDTFRFGDYLFVHAGIRPGVVLDEQTVADLRWIRDPFLADNRDHHFVVVHGHTISDGVDERGNRIGIDTGAYRTGVLTALGIEDEQRWYLTAQGQPAEPYRLDVIGKRV